MRYSLILLAVLAATTFAAQNGEQAASTPQVQPLPQPQVLTAEPVEVIPTTNTTIICNQPQQQECSKSRDQDMAEDSPLAEQKQMSEPLLSPEHDIRINVVGQGVAPMTTVSPAQAYALAKRAAIADAYRLIAEKVKGVRVEGQDVIKNMMVQRSTVRTYVDAMIRDANAIETTFKDGLCEVEMEIVLSYSQFAR
jgi:hypothetical protein